MEASENKEPPKTATRIRWLHKWQWWLVGVLLLLIPLGVMVVLVLGWNEPKHMDRSMSYWIAELNGTNYVQHLVAADALAKIGEPSLEPLLLALRKQRSFVYDLRDKVRKVAPASPQKHIPPSWPVDVLQFNACVGLAAMGPKAESAIPDLIPLLTNASPALVSRATYALNQIGTNAHPALIAGMRSPDRKMVAQCELILVRAGVVVASAPIPSSPPKLSLYQIKFLEQFLNASEITVDEIKQTLKMFQPRIDDAVATLEEKLKVGSDLRRARVALLLANLCKSSEPITQTMMENLEQLPEAERVGCACGLRYQGKHLQPYFDRLKKMAEDPSAQVALQIVLLLEKEFGDSQPKWALVDRIQIGENEDEWLLIKGLLYDNVRTGWERDRTITSLRRLLESTNVKISATALDLISPNPKSWVALQPEVERLQARLASTDKLKAEALRVLMVMKIASSSPDSIPLR